MSLNPPVSSSDHALGPADAPVTLVEFGDYQCPYCGEAREIVAELLEAFGDRLRYVFRNYPLTQLHPHALAAAQIAEAAAPERFWPLHEILYDNQEALEPEDLVGYAETAGVPQDRIAAALEGETLGRVEADLRSGEASGVQGTPSFFINGRLHEGDWSARALAEAIERAAAEA